MLARVGCKMDSLVTMFKLQYNYVTQLFQRRSERFEQSFTRSILENEPTAEEVFRHAIMTMYKHSVRLMDPSKPLSSINMELDASLPLKERYLEGYRLAIETFEKAVRTIPPDQLDEKAEMAPPHAQHMTLREWLSFVAMHTVGHVAQALRLQAIALRQS